MAEKEEKDVKKTTGVWKYEQVASILGKWAWVILLLDALIYIILGIYFEVDAYQDIVKLCASLPSPCPWEYEVDATHVWYIVGAVVSAIFAVVIVKPRFSDKCAAKEWDELTDDVLVIGGYRIPWMFIWCLIAAIFGQGWGTFPILVPALFLIFAGPKPYEWKA